MNQNRLQESKDKCYSVLFFKKTDTTVEGVKYMTSLSAIRFGSVDVFDGIGNSGGAREDDQR